MAPSRGAGQHQLKARSGDELGAGHQVQLGLPAGAASPLLSKAATALQKVAVAYQVDGEVRLSGRYVGLEKVGAHVASVDRRPRGLCVLEMLRHQKGNLAGGTVPPSWLTTGQRGQRTAPAPGLVAWAAQRGR